MPKIQAETAGGLVETEAPDGKKLVLTIEDAGVDILHRCGGNARCTTCRVEVLEGDPGEMGELEGNRTRAQHSSVMSDSRAQRSEGPRREPGQRTRYRSRSKAAGRIDHDCVT